MLGTDREPVVIDQMLVPPEQWGVRCISIGYFVPEGQAVIWRGPMLHKALEQFLTDVFWDDPEFLLVDMPPGTGDIALSLSQYLPRGEVLRRHHAAAGRAEGRPAVGGHGGEGAPPGEGRHREHVAGSPATTASATSCSAPVAARSSPTSSACRCSASSRWCRRCAKAATPAGRSPRSSPTARRRGLPQIAERIAVELEPRKVFSPQLKIV